MTPELDETRKGTTLAVHYCGHWPTTGTLAEYLAAAQRAEREKDRAVECWTRWRRRFDPDAATLELGSGRTNVRYEIARGMLEHYEEVIRLLTGPPEGSA